MPQVGQGFLGRVNIPFQGPFNIMKSIRQSLSENFLVLHFCKHSILNFHHKFYRFILVFENERQRSRALTWQRISSADQNDLPTKVIYQEPKVHSKKRM